MHYHDGKTPHTSPQFYTDIEGQLRNFAVVDHDHNTRISVPSDASDPKEELKKYRSLLIEKIMSLPAAAAPLIFDDFRTRTNLNGTPDSILWNQEMLRNDGVPLNQLQDIYTLTSNKVELHAPRH